MVLSFAESAKRIQTYNPSSFRVALEAPIFSDSDKYEKYQNYSDSKISTIDESRNIQVEPSQINLTQEINSQYIPFEMPRYFDGIDLMEMTIVIHFVNPEGLSDHAKPVNVSYSDDKIRFAWLVDEKVTSISGEVKFEIIAFGLNEKQNKYLWKSKSNGRLHVESSLSGNGVIPEDTPGYMDLLEQVEQKANEAELNANASSESAIRAENAVQNVEETIDGVKQEIIQEVNANVDTKINTKLVDYYTKPEVDDIADNILPSEIYGGTSEWDMLMELERGDNY